MLKLILHMFCVQIYHMQEEICNIRISKFDIISVASKDYVFHWKQTVQPGNYLPTFRSNLLAAFA